MCLQKAGRECRLQKAGRESVPVDTLYCIVGPKQDCPEESLVPTRPEALS